MDNLGTKLKLLRCLHNYSIHAGRTSLEADKEPSVAVEETISHWSLG